MTEETVGKPGDSVVQRAAEKLAVAWLADHLKVEIAPRPIAFPVGSRIYVDAVCDDPRILCEAWAHQGPPKAAQKAKVMNDAMKLLAARRLIGEDARLILLFADEEAAWPFKVGTWRAAALAEAGIECLVAELTPDVRDAIRQVQVAQFR